MTGVSLTADTAGGFFTTIKVVGGGVVYAVEDSATTTTTMATVVLDMEAAYRYARDNVFLAPGGNNAPLVVNGRPNHRGDLLVGHV